ncbi:luciferase-like protein [Ktedonobacter sp. SOSP1-52]|uniref:LLM class flavin-dependent oxidoreductase n=1 Tax=Ktedonobacter sp. SOSP1-52 TaxID=2778366 RepID=UPI0019163DF0|nr:LLM class flavin-dependent oxidoreductase [Ktedonobacter sp. SOSP1-52]GHO62464.1 luciferase-like protein [Ktedonobacter sp. SOSP1-52]
MRYGLSLPNGGVCGDARVLAELGCLAEESGWDGVFVEDYIVHQSDGAVPTCDPWIALAAMAIGTKHMRLGTSVTPLSRRRPWKVAREALALDQLSNGRFILGVGSGDAGEAGFTRVNEVSDAKERAKMLDEALDVIVGLWSGEPFSYEGQYYQVREMTFLPTSVQKPRIPILVGGGWPLKGPSLRAARYEGCCLYKQHEPGDDSDWTPDEVHTLKEFIESHRSEEQRGKPYEIKLGGLSRSADWEHDRTLMKSLAEAGVTWWVEYIPAGDLETMREGVLRGPLRVE